MISIMNVLPLHYYLLFLAGSFLVSLGLTPVVRKLAFATGQVAAPKDTRWHKKPTALMGGVAIFLSTVFVWALSSQFVEWQILSGRLLPLLLCASGAFVLGLADDIFNMDPQHKLAGQIVIASILMVFVNFRLEWTSSETINLFITIVWIIGITNAFNLLDNMDGLSAGVAFIAGTFLFLTHYLNPQRSPFVGTVLFMSVAYLGALLGFLVYNFNPASIFMGDAGSLFIGFVIACLTVLGSPGESLAGSAAHVLSVMAVPILILFIPILDTGFVSVMRKLFSRPISQGGKDHSSHRMVAIGLSERKAVLVLYAFSVASGFIALAIHYLSIGGTLLLIVLYLLFVVFFWVYLGRVKVYEEDSILSKNGFGAFTPLVVQLTYRRRLFEVLLDFVLITTAYYASYLLRFEGPVYYLIGPDFEYFLKSLPIVVACQVLCFHLMGIYRGVWESTSLSDLVDYIKAISAGTIMSMLILLFVYRFQSFSRAIFVIHWVLLLVMISLSRLSFRFLDEGLKRGKRKGKPALIYGAGVGGQMVAKEIENNQALGMFLVGFLDDNPQKLKTRIMGYPVLGDLEGLEEVIKEKGIQEIIISFRKNGVEKKKEVKTLCAKLGAEVGVRQMRFTLM